ncbi:three-fingered toxin-21 [Crotalus adamanteus]|uniref:Three-fingered toxin-21 n=1 Tax=Crotalus adamanteus TaxID=8729 RepID=A0AAW1BLL4_CROAD
MKALLFALVVVAFVCKDPESSLLFLSFSPCGKGVRCDTPDKFCFALNERNGKPRDLLCRGCTPICYEGNDILEFKCCNTDYCNV